MEEYKDDLTCLVSCLARFYSTMIDEKGFMIFPLTKKEIGYLIDIIETEIDKA